MYFALKSSAAEKGQESRHMFFVYLRKPAIKAPNPNSNSKIYVGILLIIISLEAPHHRIFMCGRSRIWNCGRVTSRKSTELRVCSTHKTDELLQINFYFTSKNSAGVLLSSGTCRISNLAALSSCTLLLPCCLSIYSRKLHLCFHFQCITFSHSPFFVYMLCLCIILIWTKLHYIISSLLRKKLFSFLGRALYSLRNT